MCTRNYLEFLLSLSALLRFEHNSLQQEKILPSNDESINCDAFDIFLSISIHECKRINTDLKCQHRANFRKLPSLSLRLKKKGYVH